MKKYYLFGLVFLVLALVASSAIATPVVTVALPPPICEPFPVLLADAGQDCNQNGIPDECEIQDSTVPDCNQNWVPDECDIEDGTSQDCGFNWIPDECESDLDFDGIPDGCDVCFNDPENDVEGGGICGDVDNCPVNPNPASDCDDDPTTPDEQCDFDKDEIGDVCDPDADGDNVADVIDNCPFFAQPLPGSLTTPANPDQSDIDGDGIGDVCDPCPADATDTCDPIYSASKTIGPEGGTLTNGAGTVRLDVPTGLLTKDTSFSITGTSDFDPQTPYGEIIGLAYDFLVPEGTTFSEPVTIKFYYAAIAPAEDTDPQTLDVFSKEEEVLGEWVPQRATLDPNALTVKATHFSRYALGIKDVTPPETSLLVTPDALWPANHEMVEIAVDLAVTDDYDPNPTVELEVTSSEPDNAQGNGDGNTVNDIQIIDGVIFLRAERAGNGDGRTYTITYTATDISGNSASQSVEVFVPHSRGNGRGNRRR